MTAKDYRKIAKVLKRCKPATMVQGEFVWLQIVDAMERMLKQDNPKFNRSIFNAACGRKS